jgi:hypothetical protein
VNENESAATMSEMAPAAEAGPQPLYKYVTMEGLKRILGEAIRFTQPSAFNDPFELLPEIVMPNDAPERRINLTFDILAERRTLSTADVEAIPDGSGSSDIMSRDIVQQLNQLIGILSLSRARNSLLMWLHYADQYAGAVVEFDGNHEFFSGQIDVEYRSTRPRRHLNSYLAGAPVPVAELCAKSDQWSHEQEVRVIRLLSECEDSGQKWRGFPVFIRRLPVNAIKSVIVGERARIADQQEIFNRIKDTNIALSLAAVDISGFAFREERIKFGAPLSKMGPVISPRTAHIFSDRQTQLGELARWMVEHHPMSKVVNRPV